MSPFEEILHRATRPEWRKYYVSYTELHSLLEKFAARRASLQRPSSYMNIVTSCTSHAPGGNNEYDGAADGVSDIERFYDLGSPSSIGGSSSRVLEDYNDHAILLSEKKKRDEQELRLAKLEKKELCHVLDDVVQKIGIFYFDKCQELSDWYYNDLKKSEEERRTSSPNPDRSYILLGREILELYAFVGVNLTSLRQILMHYDNLIRALNGTPLGEWYLDQRKSAATKKNDSLFEAILTRRRLISLSDEFISSITIRDGAYGKWISNQISQIEMNIQTTEQVVDLAVGDWWASIAYYFITGSLLSDLLLTPRSIRVRERTLIKYMVFYSRLREDVLNRSCVDGKVLSNSSSLGGSGPRQLKDVITASVLLNFIAHFLYMTGHYIVEPTSMKYIRALGGNDALASTLVGMAPWAALIASFSYSIWSNRSFRQPLLCSGLLLIIGSFAYATAFEFHSVWMAMVGRFLQGLGAPTVICVRHIADTVRSVDRTAISAILVTVGALGMSFGPGVAVLLDFIAVNVYIPMLGEFTVNGMTAPGYFMLFSWSLYYVALIRFFTDDERIGLIEKAYNAAEEDESQYYDPPRLPLKRDQSATRSRHFSFDRSMQQNEEHQEVVLLKVEPSNTTTSVMNEATIICTTLKFIGKFVLEILACSISMITMHRYDWSVKNIGTLSFVNGLLIMPISTFVGYLSQYYSDLTLLRGLLCSAITGTLLLIDFTDFFMNDMNWQQNYNAGHFAAVGPKRYVIGIVLQFCSFQAAQSVLLSMMSKVVPLTLAKGTFNSGFIATAMATLARAVGNSFITVMAFVSTRQLLNLLAVPSSILALFCLGLSIFHGRQLVG